MSIEITPLVSVITPSYNHSKYIQETIESVVNQTYKNIEYFIIDDGSTDKSIELIERLKEKYDSRCRIDFEVQENKGLAFTMNKLISKCNGKYIALIESDDVWKLDKIEKQVAFLEKRPDVAVCGGNALRMNESSEILPDHAQRFIKYSTYNLQHIISTKALIYPLTAMVRKEVYDMVGDFDEDLPFVDLYTWLKITSAGYPIVILPDLFGFYRVHKTNVHNDPFRMYNGAIQTFEKFKEYSFYKKAKRQKRIQYFPYLAVFKKKEAWKVFFSVANFNFRFITGCILLVVPAIISKSVIKFVVKFKYKEYSYLTD